MRDILHMIEIQVWQGRKVGRIYLDWGILSTSSALRSPYRPLVAPQHDSGALERPYPREVRVPHAGAAGMDDAMIAALFPIRSGASVLGWPTTTLASLFQT
jgi:hypothetical protein